VSIRGVSLLGQNLRPGFLRIVEHERDELYDWLLRGIASRVRLADRRAGITSPAAKQGKKISPENETENQENKRAADADVHAAELEAATSAFIATVFDVLAFVTGRPFHKFVLLTEEDLQASSSQAVLYVESSRDEGSVPIPALGLTELG
jgi:hypothetical protein